jgi:hypothetical protein
MLCFLLCNVISCRYPGLQELSKRVRKDLQYLAYPARDWVPPRQHPVTQEHVFDVLVVGGGQCGLTTAFGLAKERVSCATCMPMVEGVGIDRWHTGVWLRVGDKGAGVLLGDNLWASSSLGSGPVVLQELPAQQDAHSLLVGAGFSGGLSGTWAGSNLGSGPAAALLQEVPAWHQFEAQGLCCQHRAVLRVSASPTCSKVYFQFETWTVVPLCGPRNLRLL